MTKKMLKLVLNPKKTKSEVQVIWNQQSYSEGYVFVRIKEMS